MIDQNSPTWPWVLRFAQMMEAKLAANRHKGDRDGWIGMPRAALMDLLRAEVEELGAAANSEAGLEAADVANFAMMIADVTGALETLRLPSEVVSVGPERVSLDMLTPRQQQQAAAALRRLDRKRGRR